MSSPELTKHVIKVLGDDIEANSDVVAPMIAYAEMTFDSIEERMRFIALVMITTALRSDKDVAYATNTIGPAINDVLQAVFDKDDLEIDDEPEHTGHTVH